MIRIVLRICGSCLRRWRRSWLGWRRFLPRYLLGRWRRATILGRWRRACIRWWRRTTVLGWWRFWATNLGWWRWGCIEHLPFILGRCRWAWAGTKLLSRRRCRCLTSWTKGIIALLLFLTDLSKLITDLLCWCLNRRLLFCCQCCLCCLLRLLRAALGRPTILPIALPATIIFGIMPPCPRAPRPCLL